MKAVIFTVLFFPLVALGFAARMVAEALGYGWHLASALLEMVFE